MKTHIILISLIILSTSLSAQKSIETILKEIEANNTTLSALRKSNDSKKILNKTGIYLNNPEVEFAYLWGKPTEIGNRTNISIKQSFDFPTTYKYKNQIAKIKNNQVDLEYQKQLREIIIKTRLICYDLIYTNAMTSELSTRVEHANNIANAYKIKFEIGETNIIEYNKAQLNLLNVRNELESLEIEKKALVMELISLNSGISIDLTDNTFLPNDIPADFEQWYLQAEQNNPILNWLKQEVNVSQKQEKLNLAMSLPGFHTGYMSEKVTGQHFQGVMLGLSIPLWQNKNSVKYAKANSIAVESITHDQQIQFYNQLKTLHTKAAGLQKSTNDYRRNLQLFDNSNLLEKALDSGEISLIEYIMEISIYYDSINILLKLDRDLNKTIAELNQYM